MTRHGAAAAVGALLCALGLGGASAASAAPVTVRDDSGQTLTLNAPAQRAVALSPHLAELVFAAGAGAKLVGVMRYSEYPPAAAALPVIGDAFALNLEAIAALRPDLLLLWQSGVNPRQQQRLPALGLPIYRNETGTVEAIFKAPQHPYTQGLLASMPRLDGAHADRLTAIAGQPPNLQALPPGCSFSDRCGFAFDACLASRPALRPLPGGGAKACHLEAAP